MKKISAYILFSLMTVFTLSSCVATSQYLKGTSADGSPLYVGPLPIEATTYYQNYYYSSRSEAAKLDYMFERLKDAKDLTFIYEGGRYNWLEAYRGGMWLARHRYRKGDNAVEFVKKHVKRSENTGDLNLVEYPNGNVHEGYYILLNEIEALEQTIDQDIKPTLG